MKMNLQAVGPTQDYVTPRMIAVESICQGALCASRIGGNTHEGFADDGYIGGNSDFAWI